MGEETDEDYGVLYFTREEALAVARTETLRLLDESGNPLRYVAFDAAFHDYVFVEFVEEADGLVKTSRSLTTAELLDSEQISDETIRAVAMEGKIVTAIRLYRVKYGAGLKEAKDAVESLMWGA